MLHQLGNKSTSFSIFFPITGSKQAMEEGSYTSSSYTNPSFSSSVDCTLSLGPPSSSHERSSGAPSNCWDIISQSKATHPSSVAASPMPNNAGGDPLLLTRRCANCDTTSTPLWRNGPRGPKSLCNACGIRYKKEERRAAASTATPPSAAAAGNDQANNIGYTNYQRQQQNSSWGCYNSNSTAVAAAANGRIDDDMDQVPYLSWRLNVVPQPTTLFQYQ